MRKSILSVLAIAALSITSCSDDDNVTNLLAEFEVLENNFKGDITKGNDITLDATKTYKLSGALVVKAGATLTIPAGTVIETNKDIPGNSLYIAVERNATINIEGTAAKPVIMTSGKDAPAQSDWGGLIICGNGVANTGANGTSEVGNLSYGGNDNTDSSGKINYLKISYTGSKFTAKKEYNGVSFFAVGSGTEVSNIYTFESGDDAIEFFGGAVNASNLVLENSYDDSLDFADGYSGTVENLYIVGVTKAGIEGSNNGDNDIADPITNATIKNVSIVKGDGFDAVEQAVNFKEGGGKQAYTNLFVEGITTLAKLDSGQGATARIAAGDFKINGKSFDTAKNTVAEYVSTEKGAGNGAALPTWADWTK